MADFWWVCKVVSSIPSEEFEICEPLGRWVEPLLESIIQLYSKLVDLDFINNLEVVEKDVESSDV